MVFTGKELSPEEDTRLHSMARSIVVKGVELPERLLDETALFLHRVVTDLPADKQRMLQLLHSSDEDLVGKTVLLVDDDARNIFALSSVLERRGMKVLTATTGNEAIAHLEDQSDLAIVLMDIMMPEMDGYQTIAKIRENAAYRRLPIIALTAKAMKGDREKCLEAGASDYLAKPVNTDQLLFGAANVAPSLRRMRLMLQHDKVNVLLVDDQPAKLLAYETVLHELGENLIKASSAREALQTLLKTDVAILLIDVCMPELDGFQLAAMIREHPRFQQTAIIFVSAIHITDVDRMRGYEMGAVDYVPVPVIPEVLRAKVKVFAELFRKTRQLEQLNADLERRVAERTAELEASNARLRESERRRSLALAAGQMGSWDWDLITGECQWDAGQHRIFGVEPGEIKLTLENIRPLIHPEDLARIEKIVRKGATEGNTFQTEARIVRPDGQTRWCICAAAMTSDTLGNVTRVSGVTIDITELKEAEARRTLLVREVDHRARNALAIVQSIVRMTKSKSIDTYVSTVEGRIAALSTAHALLAELRWEGASLNRLVDEELAPYRSGEAERIAVAGPAVFLKPETAQIIALVLHELATNAVKYGALSTRPAT